MLVMVGVTGVGGEGEGKSWGGIGLRSIQGVSPSINVSLHKKIENPLSLLEGKKNPRSDVTSTSDKEDIQIARKWPG